MPVPFAINGLGRIGRALVRIAETRPGLELAAVNDIGTVEQLAHLLAHDSLHGPFAGEVAAADGRLVVNGRRVEAFSVAEAQAIPWQESSAIVVIDATGWCKTRALAEEHVRPGIERVIVSANADVDLTICMGIRRVIGCSAARRAPPTAWRRSPSCCSASTASPTACSTPCTATTTISVCSTTRTRIHGAPGRRR
jgi:glyceraldehyde-3-phosphate dehydrogenase/erythrose-4-phosphate dehydrogenase